MPDMGLPLAYGGAQGAQTLEDVIAQRQALNEFHRQLRLDEQRRLIAEREAQQRQEALGLQSRDLEAERAWRDTQRQLREREITTEDAARTADREQRDRIAKQEEALAQEGHRIQRISASAAAASAAAAQAERERRLAQDRASSEYFNNLSQEAYAKGDTERADYFASLARNPALAERFGVTDPKTAHGREIETRQAANALTFGQGATGGGVTVGGDTYDPMTPAGKPGQAPPPRPLKGVTGWAQQKAGGAVDPTLGYVLPKPPGFTPEQLPTEAERARWAQERAQMEALQRAAVIRALGAR